MWSLIFCLGRDQPPLSTVLLFSSQSFGPQGTSLNRFPWGPICLLPHLHQIQIFPRIIFTLLFLSLALGMDTLDVFASRLSAISNKTFWHQMTVYVNKQMFSVLFSPHMYFSFTLSNFYSKWKWSYKIVKFLKKLFKFISTRFSLMTQFL